MPVIFNNKGSSFKEQINRVEGENSIIMKIIAALLLLINLTVSGEGNEWKQVRDRNGVKVYNRRIEGIDFKEFMGEVKIETDLEDLLSIFNDVDLGTEWIENVDHMEEVEKVSENEGYTYTYSKAPWPVKDRDAVAHNLITINLEEKEIRVVQQGAPEKVPSRKDAVRVEKLNSSWVFTEKEDGIVHVRYQVLTDPGGRLPAWLINRVSVSQPYETLLGLKKLAEN